MKIQTSYGEVHVLTNCPLLDSTEALSFTTEVSIAWDGTEQRNQQLDQPRQILSFNYVNMRKDMGDMFHMLYANLRKTWGIPLPQLKQSIPDVIEDDFIQMDTSVNPSDLRAGFALVRSSESDQVVEITGIGRYVVEQQEERDPITDEVIQPEIVTYQDGFKLAEEITATHAEIMPLRICIIEGDANINTGGFWSSSSVVFLVLAEDGPNPLEDTPTQYKNHDFYTRPLLLDGSSLEMTLTQHQVIRDAGIGQFMQYTDHLKPKYMKPMRCLIKSKLEFIEFRKFLMRRAGRYREFWLPLYEKHLNILNTGNITTSLSTNTQYIVEADRKHIAVKRKDGAWSAHEITGRTGGSLTVSPAINAHRNDIQSICYLGLHRLDADRIEFQFLGGQKVQTTIPIIEIEA